MVRNSEQNHGDLFPEARIHESVYIDEAVSIGPRTAIWHFSHIQSEAWIGADCTLGQNVNVANRVKIGNHVKIQNNVSVYEGVTLEDHVFVGPSVVFTNVHVPRGKVSQRGSEFYRKTVVREGASIGANATIVCGHDIGRAAFIAAGAVVTKAVKDFAVVKGVPARQSAWICECGEHIDLPTGGILYDDETVNGRDVSADTSIVYVCPNCSKQFVFVREEEGG